MATVPVLAQQCRGAHAIRIDNLRMLSKPHRRYRLIHPILPLN